MPVVALMADTVDDARSVLDAGGYLFQLRLKHEIESTYDLHGWQVVGWEMPWRDNEEVRFVDIVLQKRFTKLVIECKRQREGHWVFPVERDASTRRHLRVLALRGGPNPNQVDAMWADSTGYLSSYEAQFCAIRGQDDSRRMPMLERVAQDLLRAVDAIAATAFPEFRATLAEFHKKRPGTPFPETMQVVPLIVTNARLSVAKIETGRIPLESGLAPSELEIESADLVRFRKSLALPDASKYPALDQRNPEERSVLIAQSHHLAQILRGLILR